MTNINLKEYNTQIFDFEWFFLLHEKDLLNKLYDLKLIDDKFFRNIDTKKVVYTFLLEEIINLLNNSNSKIIFIVKPEIFSNRLEFFNFYDKDKFRKHIIILFKFLIKNKFNIFIFMKKSFIDIENILDITSPEIKDFLDVHIVNSDKKLFSKIYTINGLKNKLFKLIK